MRGHPVGAPCGGGREIRPRKSLKYKLYLDLWGHGVPGEFLPRGHPSPALLPGGLKTIMKPRVDLGTESFGVLDRLTSKAVRSDSRAPGSGLRTTLGPHPISPTVGREPDHGLYRAVNKD